MVQKPHARSKMPASKQVKLKHHHSKPYRKRHLGLLIVLVVTFVVLMIALVQYRDQVIRGITSGQTFVSDLFTHDTDYDAAISSEYGFSLTYDTRELYASAISGEKGELFVGGELNHQRPYHIVRFAPNTEPSQFNAQTYSSLTLTYHPEAVDASQSPTSIALNDGNLSDLSLEEVSKSTVSYDGVPFEKILWKTAPADDGVLSTASYFVTFGGMVKGKVMTIVEVLGINSSNVRVYDTILASLKFDTVAALKFHPSAYAVNASSPNIFDTLTGTSIASAASDAASLDSERIAATYSPAVPKIYSVYCMDISLDGALFVQHACQAGSGTGFFLSQDGYIATNGHVAAADPQDIAIYNAAYFLFVKGDARYLSMLAKVGGVNINNYAADNAGFADFIDALYKMDSSHFTTSDSVHNLMVTRDAESIDIKQLLVDTENSTAFNDPHALNAKLVAKSYRSYDNIDGYRESDMAILKVEGNNFPVVSLGAIDSVSQGSNLSIIGYPGNADSNIVDTTAIQATLTTGKVSSIKNAAGGDSKLIETDTTIGHGNSGGPVFNNAGEVVGIATYSIDAVGYGDGTYNYIRDIQDLKNLANENDIVFDTESETQAAWETGLDKFYNSHYSSALGYFKTVQQLYPDHTKAAEFIASSEKRIANGEDVPEFPVIPVIIAASVLVLVGIGVAVLLIVLHNRKHKAYKAGVLQGSVQPTTPGASPQAVIVTPQLPQVEPVQMAPPVTNQPAMPQQPMAPPTTPTQPPQQPQPTPPINNPATTPPGVPEAPIQPPQPTAPAQPAQPVQQENPWFNASNTLDDSHK